MIINTNIAATMTANSMKENQRTMENTMERLSTGKRINSASDDAAGLAIETRMTSQIKGLSQAARNANDGSSMLQTADGALGQGNEMLQRMRELSVQASTGTLGVEDIANLDQEFAALASEIDRLATDMTFNNVAILASTANYNIMVGADEADVIVISMTDSRLPDELRTLMIPGTGFGVNSDSMIQTLDFMIEANVGSRVALGASINRLEYTVDNLNTTILNTQAAKSQIVDADYASETTELARTQIISQASTAMLSQANQQSQAVLALLK